MTTKKSLLHHRPLQKKKRLKARWYTDSSASKQYNTNQEDFNHNHIKIINIPPLIFLFSKQNIRGDQKNNMTSQL